MNGVVFQISVRQMATSAEVRWLNQAKSPRWNQLLTKPESLANANCQAKAETTVMIPYGSRIDVRTVRRPKTILCITMARVKPMTSSTATVTAVMMNVVTTSDHHTLSVRMTPELLSPMKCREPGSVSRYSNSDR